MGFLTGEKISDFNTSLWKPENNSPITGEKISYLGLKPEKKWDV